MLLLFIIIIPTIIPNGTWVFIFTDHLEKKRARPWLLLWLQSINTCLYTVLSILNSWLIFEWLPTYFPPFFSWVHAPLSPSFPPCLWADRQIFVTLCSLCMNASEINSRVYHYPICVDHCYFFCPFPLTLYAYYIAFIITVFPKYFIVN